MISQCLEDFKFTWDSPRYSVESKKVFDCYFFNDHEKAPGCWSVDVSRKQMSQLLENIEPTLEAAKKKYLEAQQKQPGVNFLNISCAYY